MRSMKQLREEAEKIVKQNEAKAAKKAAFDLWFKNTTPELESRIISCIVENIATMTYCPTCSDYDPMLVEALSNLGYDCRLAEGNAKTAGEGVTIVLKVRK